MQTDPKSKSLPLTLAEWQQPLASQPLVDPILEPLLERLKLRESAVLVPLMKKDGTWQILFTRRSMKLRHHRGQISFPGGKVDADDPSHEYTAIRETEEEIGVERDSIQVLGSLPVSFSIAGFTMTPIVGVLPEDSSFVPNEAELDEVFLVPAHDFLQQESWKLLQKWRSGDLFHNVYNFAWKENYDIWGATARILKQFIEIYAGELEYDTSIAGDIFADFTIPEKWWK